MKTTPFRAFKNKNQRSYIKPTLPQTHSFLLAQNEEPYQTTAIIEIALSSQPSSLSTHKISCTVLSLPQPFPTSNNHSSVFSLLKPIHINQIPTNPLSPIPPITSLNPCLTSI